MTYVGGDTVALLANSSITGPYRVVLLHAALLANDGANPDGGADGGGGGTGGGGSTGSGGAPGATCAGCTLQRVDVPAFHMIYDRVRSRLYAVTSTRRLVAPLGRLVGSRLHGRTVRGKRRPMTPISVTLEIVHTRMLAAARREVAPGGVAAAWRPAVSKVWDFLGSRPGLRTDGHNIFLYYGSRPDLPIQCDFGVEVTRSFERAGEVYATETHGRESTGYTWEIYGDPTPDPAETETTVVRLLK